MKKLFIIKQSVFLIIFGQFIVSGFSQDKDLNFRDRLANVPKVSGFKMEGYWIWGGSLIKVDGLYHLFASRWPKESDFPDDYFFESEIVRATSLSPVGPFKFREVVIGERDSAFWDSNMAHNPTIHKIEDYYVLFYIGSDFSTNSPGSKKLIRRIGYATSKIITGPWQRSDSPIIIEESNNPAILVEEDLSVKIMYRDEKLKVKLAEALSYQGPFQVMNENAWPTARLEDFYLFKKDGKYHCICEDNEAEITGHMRWGAHLVSENGITDWKEYKNKIAYNHDIIFIDGDTLSCNRRERPQLYIEEGKIKYLLNGVYDGIDSWCQPVPIIPYYP